MSWESKNVKGFTGASHCAAFPDVLCHKQTAFDRSQDLKKAVYKYNNLL